MTGTLIVSRNAHSVKLDRNLKNWKYPAQYMSFCPFWQETDEPFVLKVKRVKELKKVIDETMSEVSDIVGVDGARTITENAIKIFRC